MSRSLLEQLTWSDSVPSGIILELCPELWSYNKVWAEGSCSQIGFLRSLSSQILQETFDGDDLTIFVYSDWTGIKSVKYEQKTPGISLADALIELIGPVHEGERIPYVVLITPGSVDRTEYFVIFRSTQDPPNLWPFIKKNGTKKS